DKNTLTGMLLMGMVIFGFMYFTKGEQERRQEQMQQTEETTDRHDTAGALQIDTITAAEAANIPAILRLAGSTTAADDSTATQTYAFENDKVSLSYDGQRVTGTVSAGDRTIDYDAVVHSRFTDDITPAQRRTAVKNLRDALADADRYRGFARYLKGDESTVTLANDVLSLEISTKGGRVARATTLNYNTYLPDKKDHDKIDTARVEICRPADAAYSFVLTSATNRFDTADFYFTPQQVNDSTVLMKLDLGQGAMWGLRYTLPKGSYVARMEVVQQNMQSIIPPSVASTDLVWHQKMARNERGRTFEERNSGIFYKFIGDSPDDLGAQGNHEKSLDQRLRWIAFKNQFFSTIMIPRGSFTSAEVASVELKNDPDYLKDLSARATLDYSSTAEVPVTIDIFYGPNLYPLLDRLDSSLKTDKADSDLDLTRLIPLGWPIFRWINTLIIIPVFTFLSKFITSYGLIIFLLTVFI
ncbi:MAG: YidC/Oxa1 family insertase periplasmic-domain containing protein, partial [Muribaculaceae bacterium]|nr:YidC/Oxa1 family insertase periplasmic-domain containing protein [Muribaculaceae bacterium]